MANPKRLIKQPMQFRMSTQYELIARFINFTVFVVLTALLLVVVFARPGVSEETSQWNEPTGFRDIPWGASLAEVQEKLPTLTCGSPQTPGRALGETQCAGNLSIGSVQTFVLIPFAAVTGGGMDLVSLSFPSSSFSQMQVTFVERYGKPTTLRTSTVRNGMGAPFENQVLEWRGQKVVVRLSKYGANLEQGYAVLHTIEGQRVRQEQSKQ